MKRHSLFLYILLLTLWSFPIAGHATSFLGQMMATPDDFRAWNGHEWDIDAAFSDFENVADWDPNLDALRDHLIAAPELSIGFTQSELSELISHSNDLHFKPGAKSELHYQDEGIQIRTESAPISDYSILFFIAIGLILIWVSKSGKDFLRTQ